MFKEGTLHKFFLIGLVLKFLNGLLEIIGGILFIFGGQVIGIVNVLAQNELIEDPADIIANSVRHFLPYFSSRFQLFAISFLLSHGIIKIVLIIALIRRKLWAYPASIVVFAFFIVYQLYRYAFTCSVWLIIFSLIDAFIIYLIWQEYCWLKSKI